MYKTILVHVDGAARSANRTDVAARLALAHEAHLVGIAPTGLSAFMFPISVLDASVPPIAFPIEEMRATAEQALDVFESRVKQIGPSSFERRCPDDEAGAALCLQARYADLVVIGQRGAGDDSLLLHPQFQEFVLLNCARPVLVLPAAGSTGDIGQRVTVAWNGSAEAIRAITSAIPLLKRAAQVHLVVLRTAGREDEHGEDPGADMALYLARHGVKVEVNVIDGTGDDGESLLSFATGSGSDLIVMGAFGHSRFRELVLGGATRTALLSSPLPLWMAH